MSPKPDVFLLSSAMDVSKYRERAAKLNATGFADKTTDELYTLFGLQKGKKVILIDDNERYLKSSYDTLKRMGAEVIAFIGPLEALKQIQLLKPDTVLSDVEMPEMDGFAVLTAINAMIFD